MNREEEEVIMQESGMEQDLPWFVYDRTQEDVDRIRALHQKGWKNLSVEECRQWMSGTMKGALNRSDLKRIEDDIYIMAQMMGIDVATNRDSLPDIPDEAYFQQMLENVGILRNAGYLYRDTPAVPEQPINTYQKVNDVERILHDVYRVYLDNDMDGYFCGAELYADSQGLI